MGTYSENILCMTLNNDFATNLYNINLLHMRVEALVYDVIVCRRAHHNLSIDLTAGQCFTDV